ncbi:MAG: YkgJ family cysteine cluster protein [Humidesulfovibrio sp.]|uniref:YkgJ family cysteine cluster protein n=1 Tax=Humidesulfovibrio sp. TaxID=2910988 RepID=UPI002734150B|nr:YkgJ family cysteine cluster protein [Humidesulfovibrio sp.]MDP2848080.1 YkgJ family cysteine cluster protein [Humidesulfovibrio sp.]
MLEAAFDCKRCGHCCQGEGGIVLTEHDRERLAAHLGLSIEEMLGQFTESAREKLRLRVGDDGFCVFFRQGEGCGVHPGRPDICRAWPYFRGNLVDSTSWEMIQTDCPGVDNAAGHEAFVQEGVDYLHEHGLIHEAGPDSPHALVLTKTLMNRKSK